KPGQPVRPHLGQAGEAHQRIACEDEGIERDGECQVMEKRGHESREAKGSGAECGRARANSPASLMRNGACPVPLSLADCLWGSAEQVIPAKAGIQ
ncbi:MAG: hypothetical protein KC917_23380, partial [Candidatus Omnitrophica bacterium]|nr:hypothetical protein [Candidatus Omnitrophota bacterium]